MRLIAIFVALLIVGVLIARQVGTGPSVKVEKSVENVGVEVPKVPVKPQDVRAFGQQMNTFMNDKASERAKKIDQETQ